MHTGAPPQSARATLAARFEEKPRFEYAVIWRRRGWNRSTDSQRRLFQTLNGARRFEARLLDTSDGLRPVTGVVILVREVAPWRPFDGRAR